jgi:hypothetical protein
MCPYASVYLVATSGSIQPLLSDPKSGISGSSSKNRQLPYNRARAPRAATPAIPIGLKVGAAPVEAAELALDAALEADLLALDAALETDLLALEAALLALEAALLALLDTEDEIWLADEAREERV